MGCAGSFPSPDSPASCYLRRGRRRERAHLADPARPRQRRARGVAAPRPARRSRRRAAHPPAPRPLHGRLRPLRGAALRARWPAGGRGAVWTGRHRARNPPRPTAASPPGWSATFDCALPTVEPWFRPVAVTLTGRAPRPGVRVARRGAGRPARGGPRLPATRHLRGAPAAREARTCCSPRRPSRRVATTRGGSISPVARGRVAADAGCVAAAHPPAGWTDPRCRPRRGPLGLPGRRPGPAGGVHLL